MKKVGTWWNDKNVELVEVKGKVYALYGWNGESYSRCWMCYGNFYMDASEEEYILTPVYKEIDEDQFEIVDYEVSIA